MLVAYRLSQNPGSAETVSGGVLAPLGVDAASVGDHRHTEQPPAGQIVRKTLVLNRIRGRQPWRSATVTGTPCLTHTTLSSGRSSHDFAAAR